MSEDLIHFLEEGRKLATEYDVGFDYIDFQPLPMERRMITDEARAMCQNQGTEPNEHLKFIVFEGEENGVSYHGIGVVPLLDLLKTTHAGKGLHTLLELPGSRKRFRRGCKVSAELPTGYGLELGKIGFDLNLTGENGLPYLVDTAPFFLQQRFCFPCIEKGEGKLVKLIHNHDPASGSSGEDEHHAIQFMREWLTDFDFRLDFEGIGYIPHF